MLKYSYRNLLILLFITTFSNLIISQTRYLIGDINNDGVINVQDIVRIVNIILQNDLPPTEYELWAADVNVDNAINIQDIIIVIEVILDLQCPDQFQFPCEYNLSECCIDSTSHFYAWEIDTLGAFGSVLMDVVIIEENDVWAVGEIRLSTDVQDRYNAAHWDGTSWELMRITAQPSYIYSQFDCNAAFSSSDIWVAANVPLYGDGEVWQGFFGGIYPYGMGWMNEIWGRDSNDIYFVHDDGNVVHKLGEEFYIVPTDTNQRLQDIDGQDTGDLYLVSGWEDSGESIVLLGDENGLTEFYSTNQYPPTDSTYGRVSSVEIIDQTAYLSTVSGLWIYNLEDDSSQLLPANDIGFNDRRYIDIASADHNDIIFLSAWFVINHFNGVDWYQDTQFLEMFGDANIFSRAIDLRGNFVVAVGKEVEGGHAIIARGYR